jgi:hypothetical protein
MPCVNQRAWWICSSTLLLHACLEPNPNAIEVSTSDTAVETTTGDGDDEVGDPSEGSPADDGPVDDGPVDDGPVDDGPVDDGELAFESITFQSKADGFTGQIPKPNQAHVVPLVLIHEYRPGQSDKLGYAAHWTDLGDAYEIEVVLTGATPDSRVRGVAAVLGMAQAPEVATVTVAATDPCVGVTFDVIPGRAFIDTIERYEPGEDLVLGYERHVSPGGEAEGSTIEYCITASDTPEASLTYKRVGFDVPDDVIALVVPGLTLDSPMQQSDSYDSLGADDQVLHLIGAQAFDEVAANDLGYTIDCNQNSPPYGCKFDLTNFAPGARVVAGGLILAIP